MCHEVAVKVDRTHGVVVAGHGIGDAVGRRVAVEDRHHRKLQRVRLLDCDRLFVRVNHEEDIGKPAHLLDATERPLELVAVAGELQELAFGKARSGIGDLLVEFLQALDRLRDGLEVGEHPAEPAVVHEVLAAAPRSLGDRLLCLALGAHEEDASAARGHVAHGLKRTVQIRHRLLEVDDVDAVAGAEDVTRHLRVPTPGVMAEMYAGFQKLAHGKGRHSHGIRSFSG